MLKHMHIMGAMKQVFELFKLLFLQGIQGNLKHIHINYLNISTGFKNTCDHVEIFF